MLDKLWQMLAIATCGGIIFASGCKTSGANSTSKGVPTQFPHNDAIDLTRFKTATDLDYHKMLQFLQRSFTPGEGPWNIPGATINDYTKDLAEKLVKVFPDPNSPFRQIPLPELFAIQAFHFNHPIINERLWSISDPRRLALVEGIVKSAAAGLNKLPNFIGLVTMGDNQDEAEFTAKYKSGQIVTENRFLLTSFAQHGYGNITFLVYSKTGKRVDWLINPLAGTVHFTPGNQFYIHSVAKTPIAPTPGNSNPGNEYLVVMEQIFPDSDTPDCCSGDERWDPRIMACRYPFDDPRKQVLSPYKQFSQKSHDTAETAQSEHRCNANQFLSITDWLPRSMCSDASCFSGYELVNMITDDYIECRRGKRINPSLDFYTGCNNTAKVDGPVFPDLSSDMNLDAKRKLAWDAFEYRVNYDTGRLTTCAVAQGKVEISQTNQPKKELHLATIAAAIDAPEINDAEFWLAARGLAAEIRDQPLNTTILPTKTLTEARYQLFKVTGMKFAPFFTLDYQINDEPNVVSQRSYTSPDVIKYTTTLGAICAAAERL